MHIIRLTIDSENFPCQDCYPFNISPIQKTGSLTLHSPITFLIGENGTGKSTLLKAIAHACNIYIWSGISRERYHYNKYEDQLYRYLKVFWNGETVPGSFFGSDSFQNFAHILDEWAASDPGVLTYFGGESLMTKSHGQCNMAYFSSRFKINGLYLMDEPEAALSPKKQIELVKILRNASRTGYAQFIIATHSPILLAIPEGDILSFDHEKIQRTEYEDTDYFRIFSDFMKDRHAFMKDD